MLTIKAKLQLRLRIDPKEKKNQLFLNTFKHIKINFIYLKLNFHNQRQKTYMQYQSRADKNKK